MTRRRAQRPVTKPAATRGAALESVVAATGPWPPFSFAPDLLSPALPLERLVP
jgi:hypothetical protein